MKRLFIRISALVALVVLGCIAIAQAQRGVDPSKTADPGLPASGSAADQSAPTDQNASLANLLPAAPGATPRPLVGADEGNPLRDGRAPRLRDVPAQPLPGEQGAISATTTAPRFSSPPSDPFQRSPQNVLRSPPLPGVSLNAQLAAPDNSATSRPPMVRGLATEPPASASRVTAASNSEIPDATPSSGGMSLSPTASSSAGGMPALPNAMLPPRGGDGMPSLGREPSGNFGHATQQVMQLAQNNPSSLPGESISAARQGAADRFSQTPAPPSQRDEPAPLQFDPRNAPAKLPSPYAMAQNDAGMPSLGNGPLVDAPAAMEGTGRPGTPQLDGPQTPQLVIQKSVTPQSIRVGKPATFRLTVANHGQVPAQGVEIHDQVPQGTQLIATMPRASRGPAGEMVWSLGTLRPGEEAAVEMQLLPKSEGEIGSVATVRFAAEASARTMVTKPALTLKTTLPNRVMIGEAVPVSITISNPGSGEATGVVLKERVPQGLECSAGNDLVYEIGPLKAGETRQIQLPLAATKGGRIVNVLSAEGDDNLKAEDRAEVEVISPQLDVAPGRPQAPLPGAASGLHPVGEQPRHRARPRRGARGVSAAGVEIRECQQWRRARSEQPDRALVVGRAADQGNRQGGAGRHAGGSGPAETAAGRPRRTRACRGARAADRHRGHRRRDVPSGQYRRPRGSGQRNRLRDSRHQPGLERSDQRADHGPAAARHAGRGRRRTHAVRIGSQPRAVRKPAQLAPKAETTYRVRVQGLQPGDLRIRVQLQTDEMQEPVTKEESTRVYANE